MIHNFEWIITFHLASCLGHKKQCFWPKINCIQMKKLYLLNSSTDRSSKSVKICKSEFSMSRIIQIFLFFQWRILIYRYTMDYQSCPKERPLRGFTETWGVFSKHLSPGKTPQTPVNHPWASFQGVFPWDIIDGS